MPLPRQTVALLETARHLVKELPADAVLLLIERNLDWEAVLDRLRGCRLLVAAQDPALTERLKGHPELIVLDIDPGPTPTQERMSLAFRPGCALPKRSKRGRSMAFGPTPWGRRMQLHPASARWRCI